MKTAPLKLSLILTPSGTQVRASVNLESVDEYALAMADGAQFPPVDVFHDGSQYILADGFHRVMAAKRNGCEDILATIHEGSLSDALRFALSANSSHGLKRTNADKRRSVVLALSEWPKLSDRSIAEMCAVGHPLVGDMRKHQLESDTSCESQLSSDDSSTASPTRIGRDGKRRRAKTKKAPTPFIEDHEGVKKEDQSPEPEPVIDSGDESAMENDIKNIIAEASPALLGRIIVYAREAINRRR